MSAETLSLQSWRFGLAHLEDQGLVKGGHRGKMAVVKLFAPAAVRRAREASQAVKGCRVFNLLPGYVINLSGCSVDSLKLALDSFITTVPDEPTTQGLTRAAETNSMIHQVPMQAVFHHYD